jgi:SAM-dependent methyltransferase
LTSTSPDAELKGRHRKMWASGDYPAMVETFLLPLGPRLAEAAGAGPGKRVLDVAAGTGNASIPAAERGASVTASDLTPELFDAGRRRAESSGVELEWVEADAEKLPFDDESFDVVMSSIGAMFAPHHQDVADELVRVCRPGGTIALLSWTPEGMIGGLFRTMGPFVPAPPPGAQPPPLWGSEEHVNELFGDRVDWGTLERDILEVRHSSDPATTASISSRITGRRLSPSLTPQRTAGRTSSTRHWTPSARNGTAVAPTGLGSSRSTCSPSVPAPNQRGSAASSGGRSRQRGGAGLALGLQWLALDPALANQP